MKVRLKKDYEYMVEDSISREIMGFFETEGLAFQFIKSLEKWLKNARNGEGYRGLPSIYRVQCVKKRGRYY
ncbi:hypothetical protein JDW15_06090 [Aerococcaceae bacterium zg-ZJ1578]|uniref:hypothetical protein n=1 Tax=Aerococcaceae bacterium zg-252 TaxID=2796928 RepID=UPI001A2A2D1C|nr:hypothetical protein [Aerococcaceae bacterium zg-1578]